MKKENTARPCMYIWIFIFCLFPCYAMGEEPGVSELRNKISRLKKEIGKLDQQVIRTDSLMKEETSRFSEQEKNYARDLERRQKEISDLKEKLTEANGKVQNEHRRQAGFRNSIDEINARQKRLMEIIIRNCEKLEDDVSNSIPLDRELRLERIRVLKRELEAGGAPLEEGFNRLNALYTSEIEFGDKIELLSLPVIRNNGETVNAKILKIGNQWALYADEEYKKFGMLERKTSSAGIIYEWKEDFSFQERQVIKDALEIKMAKRPPSLVKLPVSLTLGESEEKKGETK